MTTTLSEGVKVPDVGSVNWAGDLEVNWNLLNGALANLSGNVKLDRDNTWTGEQSFTLPIVGSITGTASKAIADEDGTSIKTGYGKLVGNQTWNGVQTYYDSSKLVFQHPRYASGTTPATDIFWQALAYGTSGSVYCASYNVAVRSSGVSDISFRLNSQTSNTLTGFVHETNADASDIAFRPIVNGTHKLGSSSYQWSSVYAQTYYYNGTAWGLDKANVWSQNQSVVNAVTPKFILQDTRNDRTYSASTTLSGGVMRWECDDKDGAPLSRISTTLRSDKVVQLQFAIFNEDSSGSEFDRTIRFAVGNTGSAVYYPEQTGNVDLGDSSHKWKSLNGVNPGALSLPKTDGFVDITSSITSIAGGVNRYTPTVNGWVSIAIKGGANNSVFLFDSVSYLSQGCYGSNIDTIDGRVAAYIPVIANQMIYIIVRCAQGEIYSARFFPCLGNV